MNRMEVKREHVEHLLLADKMACEARYRVAVGMGRLFDIEVSRAREMMDGCLEYEQVLIDATDRLISYHNRYQLSSHPEARRHWSFLTTSEN